MVVDLLGPQGPAKKKVEDEGSALIGIDDLAQPSWPGLARSVNSARSTIRRCPTLAVARMVPVELAVAVVRHGIAEDAASTKDAEWPPAPPRHRPRRSRR